MKSRTLSQRLFLGGILFLMLQGCGLLPGNIPTPTLQPTATLLPTSTPRPLPTFTEAALLTDTATPELASSNEIRLSTEPYSHQDGLFEVYPPEGWTVEEDQSSAAFLDPANVGFIYLQVTNTGYALDAGAFEKFITARESNFFGTYAEYQQLERQFDPTQRIASVLKSLLFDGVSQTVITYYDQKGEAIYALDFWADTESFEAYNPVYNEFFQKIVVDSAIAAELRPYAWVFTYTGPSNLYSIEVPTSWRYVVDENDRALIETFYAPDDHALIQNITYTEGRAISRSEAGELALDLLNNFYAPDIIITEDKIQPDGSERLTWYSPGGGYRGVSFLETRETSFLLFTVMYDNSYEEYYLEVLDYTVASYDVP
jgi:hypothetical protein